MLWPPRRASRSTQSRMTLPESPDRAAANAASWSRNPNRCGDRGRDVQPRLEHHGHLVPGLVHLPAVDAPEREQLEHDLVDVERDLLGGDAQDRDARRHGPCWRSRRRSAAGLPDISSATSNPSTMPSSRWTSREVALARVDGDRRAHPHRRSSGASAFGSRHDHEARAGVAHDRGRHEADRPGAGDQHVLAEDRERERGVDRVAERVEDRGHVVVDARRSGARRWSSAGRRTRRTRRRGPRPGPPGARTGGVGRRGSGGTARRSRGPRRDTTSPGWKS